MVKFRRTTWHALIYRGNRGGSPIVQSDPKISDQRFIHRGLQWIDLPFAPAMRASLAANATAFDVMTDEPLKRLGYCEQLLQT